MKELTGNHLTEFPFQNIFKVGDLVNYQGPLLSLFANNRGELYLFHWCDNDDKHNRWLVFKITLPQLIQYLKKHVLHYELITIYSTDYIVSVDIDNDLNYHNVISLNVEDIPNDYLPDRDVIHDNDETPHFEKIKVFINQLEIKADESKKIEWQH